MNIAAIILFCSAVCYSFYPLLNVIGLETATPVMFSFVSHVFTALVGAVIMCVLIKSPALAYQSLLAFFRLPGNAKVTACFSAVSVYLGNLFFIFSLMLMSKAGAAVIMEMWPILAVFVSAVVLDKAWAKLRGIDFFLMAICLVGVVMIMAAEKGMAISAFFANPFFMFKGGEFSEYLGILLAFLAAYCFAFSGVSRARFVEILPDDFSETYFKPMNIRSEIALNLYIHVITCILGLPLALTLVVFIEPQFTFGASTIPVVIGVGLSLALTSALYSLALLKAESPSVNVLWYFAPVLAAVWLVLTGNTDLNALLVLGIGVILLSNITLIFVPQHEAPTERVHTVEEHDDLYDLDDDSEQDKDS